MKFPEVMAQADIVVATADVKGLVLLVAAAHALVRRAGPEELFPTHWILNLSGP